MFDFNPPSLTQIIYTSKPSEETAEVDLVRLVRKAQDYNIAQEISGFLLSDSNQLVQLIEGSEKDVDALFEKIIKDDRHHSVEIKYRAMSHERVMPFLGMGLCFIKSNLNLQQRFYFTPSQAREFSGLIEGQVGQFFRGYLL
jgi:hypothetical protein